MAGPDARRRPPARTRPSRGASRHRRRRTPLAAQAAQLAGRPVPAALPLHRLDPRLVDGVALVELAAFAALLSTGHPVAILALAAASAAFLALHLADRRAVLALHDDGDATLLRAGRSGRPDAVLGTAPRGLDLPAAPSGWSQPLDLGTARWWLSRGAYPLVRDAAAAARPAARAAPGSAPGST